MMAVILALKDPQALWVQSLALMAFQGLLELWAHKAILAHKVLWASMAPESWARLDPLDQKAHLVPQELMVQSETEESGAHQAHLEISHKRLASGRPVWTAMMGLWVLWKRTVKR